MKPKELHKPLPPDTTEQEDIVTLGQRRVNIMWESTQAIIAITVTAALVYISIHKIDAEELKNAFFFNNWFLFQPDQSHGHRRDRKEATR